MDNPAESKQPSHTHKDAVAKVHDVADEARRAGNERIDLLRDQADSAKAKAAERVRKLGHAVRKIGEHMRIEDQLYIAERAQGASERLESAASYIDDTELSTLIQDAERLTRRNPAWVIGGTFLVGLAAGRVLKLPGFDREDSYSSRGGRTAAQLREGNNDEPATPQERKPARAPSRREEPTKQAGARR